MNFLDFISVFTETTFIREVISINRGKYPQSAVSWFCYEGCTVTVNGETVLNEVHRICLVNKNSNGLGVYFSYGENQQLFSVELSEISDIEI